MRNDDRGKAVRINGGQSWDWQAEWRAGGGVPLFGVFLILLGIILIIGEFYSLAHVGVSAFFLAVGIVLLGAWARDRNHGALYLGMIITALAAASLLTDLHVIHGSGWGTFFIGIGFLAIAGIRAAGGSGWGWQVVVGALLALSGGSDAIGNVLNVNIDSVIGPLLIVLLGVLLITRGGGRSRRI